MMEKWYDKECIIQENIDKINYNISKAAKKSGRNLDDITLVAATKTVSSDIINCAIKNGINNIGENRVQELLYKYDEIDKTKTKVHFIGHLQKNKVKDIVGKVHMVQSVDDFELARKISHFSVNRNLNTDILIEVNIGNDINKFGVSRENTMDLIYKISELPSIKIRGLMSILPICENKQDLYKYFNNMRELFIDIGKQSIDNINMDFLSMGMSSDYMAAIECGANMVRIGSSLFGKRV